MENCRRNFVKIIKEICKEDNIEYKSFSYDWIFQLNKNKNYNYIIGYQFGLNSASVHSICCDKSAASEIMTTLNIPNVEHYFFMSPNNQKYIGEIGNWSELIKKLNDYGELVCKTNEGSGGKLVFHVKNQFELEKAVHTIFRNSRSMSVCPYYNIKNEYRVIVLDGEIKLIYLKQRPYIIGDGKKTVLNLILENNLINKQNIKIEFFEDKINQVLGKSERLELNWKHNLGQGAKAIVLDKSKYKDFDNIINEIVDKMNIRFASIDIVESDDGFKVLEINSGVMMEHFSQQDEASYLLAKQIYRQAIDKMFRQEALCQENQ